MKIPIAEDEILTRSILESILADWGHEVVAVADGAEAWGVLSRPDAPRLAILDWEMPGMTGPEICRKARCVPNACGPYLLLLTAREGRENGGAGLGSGANDYLTKPLDPDELRVRLDVGISLLELQHLEATSREPEGRVRERTAELARANAENERLFAAISSVFISLDGNGRVTRWNRTAEEVFNVPAGRVLGEDFAGGRIPWEDAGITVRVPRCGRERRQDHFKDVPFTRSNGRRGFLDLWVSPVEGNAAPPRHADPRRGPHGTAALGVAAGPGAEAGVDRPARRGHRARDQHPHPVRQRQHRLPLRVVRRIPPQPGRALGDFHALQEQDPGRRGRRGGRGDPRQRRPRLLV